MSGYTPTRSFTPAEQEQLRARTVGLKTKSAKIRALSAVGYPRATIAAYLGISYQHVHSVLGSMPAAMEPPSDTAEPGEDLPDYGIATIGTDGHVELTGAALAVLGHRASNNVVWRIENDNIILMGRKSGLRWAQDLVAKYSAGDARTWSEQLMEERRLDLAREEELERTHE